MSSRSKTIPCIWADVGGTFTDVFLVEPGQRRRSAKTLSSGLVYATVVAIGSEISDAKAIKKNSQTLTVDKLPAADCDGFWNTARWTIGESSTGTVAAHHGHSLTITDHAKPAQIGDTIILDAGIEAPVLAARMLMKIPIDRPLPPLSIRLGTTRGTNALLTRAGAKTALLVTKGFGDLLRIGEQQRDDLFALHITQPDPLTSEVVEVEHRVDASGRELQRLNLEKLTSDLKRLRQKGIESIAIALLHSYAHHDHEQQVESVARQCGFPFISRSSEVSPLIKLVSRAETTTLDAYLNPILSQYVNRLRDQFGSQSDLLMMTSAGNLVRPERFRGRDSVLSGPAGGIVALAKIARDAGATSAIGLDMGGTSTDVSRFEGKVGRRSESKVAGVRIMTPMMDIHTVAAGGGSICSLTDGRLTVGPNSAGATPGPACYGRGGPLTITDVNLLLGRLPESKFPFRLDRNAAQMQLTQIASELDRLGLANQKPTADNHDTRWTQNLESLAEGFLDIAVTHMAEAIRTISTAQGSDVRDMTLVGFGGAAGGHVCRVANQLGMKRILDHPDAGLMSALGMGIASVGTTITRGIYQAIDQVRESEIIAVALECCAAAQSELQQETVYAVELDVRYVGTESSLTVAWYDFTPDAVDLDLIAVRQAFLDQHQSVFGYVQPDRPIEIVSLRCDAAIPSDVDVRGDFRRSDADLTPKRGKIWHGGEYIDVQVWDRNSISAGDRIDSPTMVVAANSTLLVEPDWQVHVQDDGSLVLIRSDNDPSPNRFPSQDASDDPVLMEVTARRLQGIADAMGERLRATAISVNIKERRDYSCAIFTADGSLVANAAHVPVHLGAMGHTVSQMMRHFPTMSDGDCYLTNDPMAGGSHLPDLTLVTPVFVDAGTRDAVPDFFVASRAHHAEIGGITPGSMPPGATCLAEEGVVIRNFALVQSGVNQSERLREWLQGGLYPSRNPDENLADLAAQAAAGVEGVKNLRQLAVAIGSKTLADLMNRLLDVAAEQTRRFVASQPDQPKRFVDSLDDGTKIGVTISKQNHRLRIAFDATPVHPGGFNATPAIVTAATLYVLRCVCPSELPLCDGVLRWIDLDIPSGMLNPPAHADPMKCAAVVAGNVETSQRIVDVLLGAMNAAAASQGTMNNFIVGDESFGYYETIGGGMGATRDGHGASGVHCHMTNTRITDPEIVETRLPIVLHRFEIRTGSGGSGKHRGGDGLIREFEFLKPLTVSLLTGRRTQGPYGIEGGRSGQPGRNWHRSDGQLHELPPNVTLQVQPHDRLIIETPGGGGWGTA